MKMISGEKTTCVETRRVTFDEIDALKSISVQTFYETFAAVNTEENMKKYLEEGFSIENLTFELNDQNSEFYFAVLETKIIGYLKINLFKSPTESDLGKAFEVERIYVLKEFHGKEVGKLLFDLALQKAKQSDADCVWLGVWEKNPRAIQFYIKNNFVEFGKQIFILGDDEQTDILMKRELKTV